MLQLTPERIDNAVVLMASQIDPPCEPDCRLCVDFSVGIHNWLLTNEIQYVMVDLQDEKDVCRIFLEELINLRKRLSLPFYFIGVMDRPRKFLNDFGISGTTHFALTPEAASEHLQMNYAPLYQAGLNKKIDSRSKITVSKARLQQRLGGEMDPNSDFVQGEVNL